MFLLRLCLLLAFSELIIPVPQDGIPKRAFNFDSPGSILKTPAKSDWSSITTGVMNINDKTRVQNTHNIMRAPKEDIADFINCLHTTNEEYVQKVLRCYSNSNFDLKKMQQSAIASLNLADGGAGIFNMIRDPGVYKCFAETPITADVEGSVAPLLVCMVKNVFYNAMQNTLSKFKLPRELLFFVPKDDFFNVTEKPSNGTVTLDPGTKIKTLLEKYLKERNVTLDFDLELNSTTLTTPLPHSNGTVTLGRNPPLPPKSVT